MYHYSIKVMSCKSAFEFFKFELKSVLLSAINTSLCH
jgi:hypothetical protein